MLRRTHPIPLSQRQSNCFSAILLNKVLSVIIVVPGQTQFNIEDRDFQSIYVPICQALNRYTLPVLDQLQPDEAVEAIFDPSGKLDSNSILI